MLTHNKMTLKKGTVLCLLLALLFAGTVQTTAYAGSIGQIEAELMLDIRAEASEDAPVIGQVMDDGHVLMLDWIEGWVQIQAGEMIGWIPEENISETDLSDEEAVAANQEAIAELKAQLTQAAQTDIQPDTQSADAADAADAGADAQSAEAADSDTAPVYSLSQEEFTLLANIIFCEAGIESYTGKVAVGNVIMNRVWSPAYPNTITEVVYQKHQFTPVRNGRLAKALANNRASIECYQAAAEAVMGAQPVGGALHFRRKNGRPGLILEHHVFY